MDNKSQDDPATRDKEKNIMNWRNICYALLMEEILREQIIAENQKATNIYLRRRVDVMKKSDERKKKQHSLFIGITDEKNK